MLATMLPFIAKLRKLPFVVKAELAGSIRRKVSEVKDADVVLSLKGKLNQVDLASAFQRIFGNPVHGGTTRMESVVTIIDKKYEVDLLMVEADSWGAALNHFTGSAQHNIWMRQRAQKMGFKVNERGIWKGSKKVGGCEEKDLFDLLQMPFLKPEERTGWYVNQG
jgi:DNA polymerase (family 10)